MRLTGSAGSNRSSPLLPVCPIPSEKAIDSFYATKAPAVLTMMADSLSDDHRIFLLLSRFKDDISIVDPFKYSMMVVEENLNQLVGWAKSAPYFEKLEVSQTFILSGGKTGSSSPRCTWREEAQLSDDTGRRRPFVSSFKTRVLVACRWRIK